jgi:hypothetical protein
MSFSFDKKKNEEEKQWSKEKKKRKLTTVNYKQTNIDTIIISQINPRKRIIKYFFLLFI